MTRGIAPLLLGYQAFDPSIRIAGVILNKVGGARHEGKLRRVIEHYTDITLVGSVYRTKALELVERHLGLMPSNEATAPLQQIESIRTLVAEQVDLGLLQRLAATATPIAPPVGDAPPGMSRQTPLRIGVAMDAAFGFYYPGDLEALERYGAQLVPFSPMKDQTLPSVDGLFIGGGFPEVCMEALEANATMRQAVADYVEQGRPMYAECGGLMYLARSLSWKGKTCRMVGVIPADVMMYERPQGRGYVRLRETAACPWAEGRKPALEIAAHEFHYSRLENLAPGQTFAFEVLRGEGIDGAHDGILYKNLLAGYTHLRDVASHHWTARFLDQVRRNTRPHAGADWQAAGNEPIGSASCS
jgi:cobyrinic acid a,c-diamide synthase